jgi:hypothetical protein
MTILRGLSNMKKTVRYLTLTLTLIILTACGGGGGTDVAGQNPSNVKTTATLKITQTGSLPAAKTISGTDFTITLPVNVTPVMTNGAVATSVVTPTGTFAGSSLAPQVTYTPATASTSGTLRVILASSDAAGLSLVGEVATITLQLTNNAAPGATSFIVSGDTVFDATLYSPIAGMNVIVSNLTLQ